MSRSAPERFTPHVGNCAERQFRLGARVYGAGLFLNPNLVVVDSQRFPLGAGLAKRIADSPRGKLRNASQYRDGMAPRPKYGLDLFFPGEADYQHRLNAAGNAAFWAIDNTKGQWAVVESLSVDSQEVVIAFWFMEHTDYVQAQLMGSAMGEYCENV